MLLKSFIGQEQIKSYFANGFSGNQLGHAYILAGPQGIGKNTFAGKLAKLLLCLEPVDNNPCGVCKACSMYDSDVGIDFVTIDESRNSISIDLIRDLQKHIILRPAYSKRKVYIIKRAETMTEEAQNCLLKTLEEPPEYAVILLLTVNPMSLRETVRSRAVRLDFARYSHSQIRDILLSHGIDAMDKFEYFENASDGIPGRALELASSDKIETQKDLVFSAIRNCKSNKAGYVALVEMFEKEKAVSAILLDLAESYFRDLLIIKTGANDARLINTDKKGIILKDVEGWPIAAIINAIAHIESCRKALAQNANFSNTILVLMLYIQEECNK